MKIYKVNGLRANFLKKIKNLLDTFIVIIRIATTSGSQPHSFSNYRQACQKCEKYVYPTYLWKNDNNYRSEKRDKDDKPH